MSKKTIILFITVFITTGIIILGVYFWINRDKTTSPDGTSPWYQSFNPFGTGGMNNNGELDPNNIDNDGNIINQEPGDIVSTYSRFTKITDFAIAGATFLEDTRPIETTTETPAPTEITTVIDSTTKEGKKDIQIFLNQSLSLNPPLVADGNLGKKSIQAIKDFQKLNNLTETGQIDTETAPFFLKTTKVGDSPEKSQFETAPSIRYVERMNGHIYKMFLDTKNKDKISNSTIPSIYEALFNRGGETVIYRYLSSDNLISSFMATLGAPKGEFLPQNISNISVSPDKTKYFYLTENSSGVTGTVGIFGETKRDIVFTSPFTEWLSEWDSVGKIYLTTKPSYSVEGSMFSLNQINKTTTKILGGIDGLTTMINPNGSMVLYNTSTPTGPRLGVYNISTNTTKDLDTYGLPEKCVWSSDRISIYCAIPSVVTGNQYPDIWYQGIISFDDYFVKINTGTGNKTTLANSTTETPVDGTYLFLDKTENTLFFTNKKDSTLWSLDLN